MSNQPLTYCKKSLSKRVNKRLTPLFDQNFNQLDHPIRYKIKNSETNELITKWPLKSMNGQPFFYGYLNGNKSEIEIYDDSVLIMLNFLGNYCNCFSLDYLVSTKFSKHEKNGNDLKTSSTQFSNHLSNPSNLFESNQDTYRHNLHIDTLNQSFKEFGKLDSKLLIDQLYSNGKTGQDCSSSINLESDNANKIKSNVADLKKKQFNSFEDTFKLVKKSFNQNFIDRSDYILKLDLEEAFFIKHVFGILSIQELNEDRECDQSDDLVSSMNLNDFWLRSIKLRKSMNQCFVTSYAAYFYFRSKGFIVKNGIKFGSDFVLYDRNPTFSHSIYSVLLVKRSSKTYDQILKSSNVQAFIRMTKCVVKIPVLCIVTFPSDLTQDELQTPESIRRLKIKCLLMDRWIASVERETAEKRTTTS